MEGGLMALWCRDCPTVHVEAAEAPKRLTLVLPFYENHEFIYTQISQWCAWPADVREHVEVIVVDDGSPRPLKLDVIPTDVRIRHFRIDTDVRWNWLAARNIGAHHAGGEWILLTDMDHLVPAETLRSVVSGAHDERIVYAFNRVEHTGAPAAPHSASFLMSKEMFWKIGGYDEDLSGHYGTDGDYRRRVVKHAPIYILRDALVRHEYVGDSSTTHYKRKQPEDAAVRHLIAARRPGWKPRTLSFPYHEVLQEVPCFAPR